MKHDRPRAGRTASAWLLIFMLSLPAFLPACSPREAEARRIVLSCDIAGEPFVSAAQTAEITVMWLAGGVYVALDPRTVRWTVEASYVSAKAWARSDRTLLNGLYWGKSAPSLSASENDRSKMEGTPPTGVRAFLTDIVGERKVTVKAVTTIGGQTYEATTEVHFGPGPLAAFAGPPHGASTWREAVKACGGTWDVDMSGYYQPQTRLPTEEQLYALAGRSRYGAAHAAGWRDDAYGSGFFLYWTGKACGDGDDQDVRIISLYDGAVEWYYYLMKDWYHWYPDSADGAPVVVCVP